MAKPMLVTFPFVLLLIDVWPLGRLRKPFSFRNAAKLVWEKTPLFVMAAPACVVTFLAQRSAGSVQPLALSPLPERVIRACIGCVSYLETAVAPTGLAVFYPMQPISQAQALLALAVLAAATLAAFAVRVREPWALVGWLWFLGMLVPVSGIVQVGTQASADRYTYLPLVGISFAVVWCVAEALRGRKWLLRAAAVVSCALLALLAAEAFRQAQYWKSSRVLFERAIAVTRGNYIMHNNLGVICMQEGKYADAQAEFRISEAMCPSYEDAHGNLGHELLRAGNLYEARMQLTIAVGIAPERAVFQGDLAVCLARLGDLAEAKEHMEQAVKDAPDKPQYRDYLARIEELLKRAQANPPAAPSHP
jgi:Flp pilus assembly protein TadD